MCAECVLLLPQTPLSCQASSAESECFRIGGVEEWRGSTVTPAHLPASSLSTAPIHPPTQLCSCLFPLTSRRCRLRPVLSPLERGAFDSLAVSVGAGRARVQLDEQLGEFELGEHGLQEALQEDVDQAAVHGLVLEHVKDAEDALPGGVRADDVLQLI